MLATQTHLRTTMTHHGDQASIASAPACARAVERPGSRRRAGVALLGALAVLGPACSESSLAIDQLAYHFGTVRIPGPSEEVTFTVQNTGDEALGNLTASVQPPNGFTMTASTCVGRLSPGAACSIKVVFTPGAAGARDSDLIVTAGGAQARAELTGTGAARVSIAKPADGEAMVLSEPPGIRCGTECDALFTTPDVALSVESDEQGTAFWNSACGSPVGSECPLFLTGDVLVELLRFDVGLRWLEEPIWLHALAVDHENNVIGTFTDGLTLGLRALSPAGELLWQNEEVPPGEWVAVDAEGNIAVAHELTLMKLDGAGALLSSIDLAEQFTSIRAIVFDPAGDLVVAGSRDVSATTEVARLAKYGKDGALIWTQEHSSRPWTAFSDMAVGLDGQVFAGGPEGTRAAIPGGTSYTIEAHSLRSYDRDGNVLWTKEDRTASWRALAVNTTGSLFALFSDYDETIGSPVKAIHEYGPDGALAWEAPMSGTGNIMDLATSPAGDVLVLQQHYAEDGTLAGISAEQLDAGDGSPRLPLEIWLPGGVPAGHQIVVDGNGDVLISGGEYPAGWLRKYDGALFRLPSASRRD